MKKELLVAAAFLITLLGSAQQIPFEYTVELKPVSITNLQGVHSFAAAQSGGRWLIIGGRKDGVHARQPFAAFPAASNNTDIFVIDVTSKQFWSASLGSLPVAMQEQLQSTNMNFYQDADTLYIIGGYGYSNTAADHITYPNLTSVNVSGLISAVISNSSITSYFKQITDQKFAVTGGQLGKIGAAFYLVGGQRFDGQYNPVGNPTYTQTYISGIQKFTLNNSGAQLSYANYSLITDQVHLHRRDYNLVPQIFPDGAEGYTVSSGVFQVSADLPFLYPVDIKAGGHVPQPAFNQYLSNYHSAKAALYDSITNTMHSIFFGGMSQYYYANGVLVQDNNVPFVKTISRVSRDSAGNLQESIFSSEMPMLVGSGAEFFIHPDLPQHKNEIIKLANISGDSVLAGHIYGGIYSPQLNPFTANQTSVTNAHNVIYEVWLLKNISAGISKVNGNNPVRTSVFPNLTNKNLNLQIELPSDGDGILLVTDISGKIIQEIKFPGLLKGGQIIALTNRIKLTKGVYAFNFVFEGKYATVEKVIVAE